MYYSRRYDTHQEQCGISSKSQHIQKLLLLVQYVSWVQVRYVTLYLACTTAIQPFYKKLQFLLQDSSNIPDAILDKLRNE